MRIITVDGNFTANHIKQKRALDDIWLTDSEGMMTACARYHAHLAVGIDTKDVSAQSKFILSEIHICAQHDLEESCFWAISEAHSASQLKDVNGIVVHACACHGALMSLLKLCYRQPAILQFLVSSLDTSSSLSLGDSYNSLCTRLP